MRTLLTFLAALAATAFHPHADAQPVAYAVDPAHTQVHWEVRHFGTSTQRGRFDHDRRRIHVVLRNVRLGDPGWP